MEEQVKKNGSVAKIRLINSLKACMGLIAPACKRIGVDQNTFDQFCKEDEKFSTQVAKIQDTGKQTVEEKLLDLAGKGNANALMFVIQAHQMQNNSIEKTPPPANKGNKETAPMTPTMASPAPPVKSAHE